MDLLSQIKSKRQQISDKKQGSKNTYRFKNKKTTIRILPTWRPADHEEPIFYHDFGMSYIKDFDGNLLAVVGDARITYGQDDPIRNLINKALGTARTDAQRQHYKEMLAKPRIIVNALVLDDKENADPNIPEIVEFSSNQFDQVLAQMQLIAEGGENPLSLSAGYDLIVEKEGSGLLTKYKFNFARKATSVPESAMENINDIDSFLRSKFTDSDRASNAIKSLTQGADVYQSKAIGYSGNAETVTDSVEDAAFDIIEETRGNVSEPVSTNVQNASQEDIDAMLADL